MRFYKILIFSLLCTFPYFSNALEKNDAISLNQVLQKTVDEIRVKYDLPVLSVSIQLPGDSHIRDYVSSDSSLQKDNITPDTLFQVGSITKTFTATILFKLIAEKKLNSHDSLTTWLPEFPRWKNITIYDLLHHTSGVANYSSGKSFDNLVKKYPQKNWSLDELAEIAYRQPDAFDPGKKYHYTNTDYVLLGMIVEKITHQPIQKVFDHNFKQYGLTHTFYPPYSKVIQQEIAPGYNRDGTFTFNANVTQISSSFGQSAGAIVSTPHDIVKWLNALFSGKMISEKSLIEMTKMISEKNGRPIDVTQLNTSMPMNHSKPFIEIGSGAGIGLVYFKDNGFTFIHTGGMPGYESLYAYNPCNGLYLVLAYNVKPKQPFINVKIANAIFKKLRESTEVSAAMKAYKANKKLCIVNSGILK